ncbi:MAG TPA: hypothetical protein VFQ61_21860, partial [Polyangiaceae bacterium]|nr:hypothetical protein [Polyangiaceae bacterium]
AEVSLTAVGAHFVPMTQERPGGATSEYRAQMNSEGSPSELVAAGYIWMPGTELARRPPVTSRGVSSTVLM